MNALILSEPDYLLIHPHFETIDSMRFIDLCYIHTGQFLNDQTHVKFVQQPNGDLMPGGVPFSGRAR